MHIRCLRESDTPLYLQIKNELKRRITTGKLVHGSRLPSTRTLANDLGVSRITTETAYAELESEGLLVSRPGSGSYVHMPASQTPEERNPEYPAWQHRTADGFQEISIREQQTHMYRYNFASGSGDPALFPMQQFRRDMVKVINRDGISCMQYGEPEGYVPLRAVITDILNSQGFTANHDNILITSGSQQAIALISSCLLQPGDSVVVENPTYHGALSLFRKLRLNVIPISVDDAGMDTDELKSVLSRENVSMIYTIPTFHNPTNVSMSGERRRSLIMLAQHHGIPILEDDYVGDLRYDGKVQPPLKVLAEPGQILYVSTFSKMLMPGLRLGFLVAEGPVFQSLSRFKASFDLTSSSFIQRLVEQYISVGKYQTHLKKSAAVYRKRRDIMVTALQEHLPAPFAFQIPQGGFFVWVKAPGTLPLDDFMDKLRRRDVALAPGRSFFASPGQEPYFRLNFACNDDVTIETGIAEIGAVLRQLDK